MTTAKIAAVLVFGAAMLAQTAAPHSFDVASIRLNTSGSESQRVTPSPGGTFTATNVSLRLLISRAYRIPEAQIVGGPPWVGSDRYDIAARAATSRELSREEWMPCLQALLAQRFGLRVHNETKIGTVGTLTVAKGGPKLKLHTSETTGSMGASSSAGVVEITAAKASMAKLAEYLSAQAKGPVLDNTGLTGEYDFQLKWWQDPGFGSNNPSIFDALQQQLGLQLKVGRGPIQMIVIDAVAKASSN